MKLLFITRKVDKSDGPAGFTYHWIKAFAFRCEHLFVICLEKGDASGLPNNCSVYSLGKERGKNRIREIFLFKWYAWKLIRKVDGVFSHQNPEYGILISLWCKVFRKKLVAWYAHGSVTWKVKLLTSLVDVIATSSREGFRYRSRKVKILHQGIDVDMFSLNTREIAPTQMLSVSRISESKRLDLMIEVIEQLRLRGIKDVKLRIIGATVLASEVTYLNALRDMVKRKGLSEFVEFLGPIPYDRLKSHYAKTGLFLNFSTTGSMDKAVLEAMSCGIPVCTTNLAYKNIQKIDGRFFSIDVIDKIMSAIESLIDAPSDMSIRLAERSYVTENHSLNALVRDIVMLYEI